MTSLDVHPPTQQLIRPPTLSAYYKACNACHASTHPPTHLDGEPVVGVVLVDCAIVEQHASVGLRAAPGGEHSKGTSEQAHAWAE